MLVENHRTRLLIIDETTKEFLVLVRNLKDKCGYDHRVLLLPGGGIDEGEEELASLLREVNEEIGYVPSKNILKLLDYRVEGTPAPELLYYFPCATKVNLTFSFWLEKKASKIMLTLKEPEKFDSYHWVTAQNLPRLAKDLGAKIGEGIVIARSYAEKYLGLN